MSTRTLARQPAQGQLLLWHMDPAAAAWVRDVVLKRVDADEHRVLIDACQCMYGPCGHCDAGRHGKCAHRQPSGWWPGPSAETYLVGRRGFPRVPVWRAQGPPCRWFCPCPVCTQMTISSTHFTKE